MFALYLLQISYVELLESTSKRQRALSESYFFDCQCPRCASVLSGDCTDDLYLDGYSCENSSCHPDRVVGKIESEVEGSSAQCKKCGSERALSTIQQLERECEDIELKLQLNLTAMDKWRLYQRLLTILVDELGLHPHNARIATLYREIGTFLMDTSASEFPAKKKPTEALQFFAQELEATVWILPTMKLPSRGLLHYQLGKLLCGDENISDFSTGSKGVEAIERAIKHFQQALTM